MFRTGILQIVVVQELLVKSIIVTPCLRSRQYIIAHILGAIRLNLVCNSFYTVLCMFNKRLKKIGQEELLETELIGLRLYTGPMFMKYNAVLRGGAREDSGVCQVDLMKAGFKKLCCADGVSNRYVTTLHVSVFVSTPLLNLYSSSCIANTELFLHSKLT